MANQNIQSVNVRIPNLPLGKIVDEKGMATPEEQMFRQGLLNLLQTLMGEQGLVMPSQTAATIAAIAAYQQPSQMGNTLTYTYPCLFGTMIYATDTGNVMVAVEQPLASGIPVFKTVTLT